MKHVWILGAALVLSSSVNAATDGRAVTIEQLTLTQEKGLSAAEVQAMARADAGDGCGNQPSWMTAGNQPSWMTAGNQPSWMTAGNQPDWMTAGNQPSWYSSGNVSLHSGVGEIPSPQLPADVETQTNQ